MPIFHNRFCSPALNGFVLILVLLSCQRALAQAVGDSAHDDQRIWWELPVATVTSGYDANSNRTLLSSFDLVVWGPSSVSDVSRHFAQHCVVLSGNSAYQAFNTAPSPELGARVAAAWTTFHSSLDSCLTLRAFLADLKDKFEIGYSNRNAWRDGLFLKFTAENPNAQLYGRLYEQVKDRIPNPINRVFEFYIKTQQIPSINIKLDPPPVLRSFYAKYHAAVAPVMVQAKLVHFTNEAAQKALRKGKQLASVAVEQARSAAVHLGAQAGRAAIKAVLISVQLTGRAAEIAKSAAPKLAEASLPSIGADGRIHIPVVPGLPGGPTVDLEKPTAGSFNPLPAARDHEVIIPVFPLVPGLPVPKIHIHTPW